ncbi:hypothetical protein M413DRAFT_443523 [Hebeloma cylindrosporum]|uniref:Uncharacterized protein n=1 Tax=Hebeloma cylindrosporum TaxID=76867 RepID=A0A0C3CHK1_HEBCY|nr:hypothetical protein M413DRAFT_443523 [Hebeloma cylindrosporum h7]
MGLRKSDEVQPSMHHFLVSAQRRWAEARTVKLARHNQEDTPDACIVSHQLRTAAFSTSAGLDGRIDVGGIRQLIWEGDEGESIRGRSSKTWWCCFVLSSCDIALWSREYRIMRV